MEIIKETRLRIALAVSTAGSIYVLAIKSSKTERSILFDSCFSFVSSFSFDDRTRVTRVRICLEYSRAANIY